MVKLVQMIFSLFAFLQGSENDMQKLTIKDIAIVGAGTGGAYFLGITDIRSLSVCRNCDG